MRKKKNKNTNRQYTDQDIKRMETEAKLVSDIHSSMEVFVDNFCKLEETNPRLANYIANALWSSIFAGLSENCKNKRDVYDLNDIL